MREICIWGEISGTVNILYVDIYLTNLVSLLLQGFRFQVDRHYDSNTMYRGYYTRDCPESNFPELERLYYNQTLAQQFPDSEEEVAQEVERRHLLKQVRSLL